MEHQGFQKDLIKSNPVSQMVTTYKENLSMELYTYDELKKFIGNRKITVSVKIDGEIVGIKYDGKRCITYTRGGMIRYDLPVTKEIENVLRKNGISEFTGIGEIYVVKEKEDIPLSYLKSQSILRLPKNYEEEERVKVIMFDVYSINNQIIINKPLSERIEKINSIFDPNSRYVRPAYYEQNVGVDAIEELWKKVLQPDTYGYEGLVIHVGDKIIKVKPIMSFDMVIVALSRSKKDLNMISAVVASFMDREGNFRFHGKIGSGFTEKDRTLLLDWAERNKVFEDDTGQIWIDPYKQPLIVEVQGEEVHIKEGAAYTFKGSTWSRIEDKFTGVIRYPVILRFRTDKTVSPSDLRMSQIPGFPEKQASLHMVAYEPKHPNTMVIAPSEYHNEGMTEEDVWKYYNTVKQKIVNEYNTKGTNAMVAIWTEDGLVMKRNEPGDGPIELKTPEKFDEYNNGRFVEFHYTLGEDVKFIYVDLDPGNKFPFEETKKIAKELEEYFLDSELIRDTSIIFSGNRGFYVYGFLTHEMPIDDAKTILKNIVSVYVADKHDDRITDKQIKNDDQIRLDISTFHIKGGLRVPYSLHQLTGLPAVPVYDIDAFKKEDAVAPMISEKASLEEYKEKRNFDKTSEPEGAEGHPGKDRFVVQEHHASHLHYDFRLEAEGVLKSWAIPKLTSLVEGSKDKVLAVQTEDHPTDYVDFEGEIPEGEYGGGTVKIYDKGSYETIDKKDGKWTFKLNGDILKGKFTLVNTGKGWLLIKSKEE